MGNAIQSQELADSPATGRTEDHAAYVGSIPEHYHRGVGAFLFDPYAQDLAARVVALAPGRLLETACGTGILTRRLSEVLPPQTQLLATDLNEPMLEVAKRTVGPRPNVHFEQADMTKLRFRDGEFDALVCNFGLMFVPDKAAAAREARRVLRPGGRLLMATWRSVVHNAPIRFAHETVTAMFPQEPPGFYLAQTGFGEPDFMSRLLADAGFRDIRTEPVKKQSSSPSARDVASGLVEGFPIADFIRARKPALVQAAVDELTRALIQHFGDAPMNGTIEALVTTATAPDAK
jgi:ubiquinone/menaquinone biosynthesis C-methylase UbiE